MKKPVTMLTLVQEAHPIRLLIEHFSMLLNCVYNERLTDVGLQIGASADTTDFGSGMIFTEESVVEMQEVGMAMLSDVQDFLHVCQKITNFFYRRCFTLENHTFQDSIVEAITNILFMGGVQSTHWLVRALFVA